MVIEKLSTPTMESDEASPRIITDEDGHQASARNIIDEDGDDEKVLQFLDSLDGYLTLIDSLSSTLRQGWFELAGARQSMGPSRISGVVLDLKEKSAPTTVQLILIDGDSSLEAEPQFSLSKWGSSGAVEGSSSDVEEELLQTNRSQIRRRTVSHLPDQETNSTRKGSRVTIDNNVQMERLKSLTVFGTLVSPKLRAAQGSFETALETVVEIANIRSKMLSAFSQLQLEKKC